MRKGPRRRGRIFTRTRCRHVGKGRRTKQSTARGRRKQTNARCSNVVGSRQSNELGK